jgi:hypothetical protein
VLRLPLSLGSLALPMASGESPWSTEDLQSDDKDSSVRLGRYLQLTSSVVSNNLHGGLSSFLLGSLYLSCTDHQTDTHHREIHPLTYWEGLPLSQIRKIFARHSTRLSSSGTMWKMRKARNMTRLAVGVFGRLSSSVTATLDTATKYTC